MRRGSGKRNLLLSILLSGALLGSRVGRDADAVDACSSSRVVSGWSTVGIANVVIFAWKASSTCWASAGVSLFFSGSERCAQTAASSPVLRSSSSLTSRSRNTAEASGSSICSAEREWAVWTLWPPARCGLCCRPPFSRLLPVRLGSSCFGTGCSGGRRSGASRSSSRVMHEPNLSQLKNCILAISARDCATYPVGGHDSRRNFNRDIIFIFSSYDGIVKKSTGDRIGHSSVLSVKTFAAAFARLISRRVF